MVEQREVSSARKEEQLDLLDQSLQSEIRPTAMVGRERSEAPYAK